MGWITIRWKRRFSKALLAACIWAFASVFVLIGAELLPHIFASDSFYTDYFLSLKSEKTSSEITSNDIVLVEVNQKLLTMLPYQTPIDRCLLSVALQSIDSYQPKVIGLDFHIDLPSEPKKDTVFFSTIKSLKTPIVIASYSSKFRAGYDSTLFLKESGVLQSQLASSLLEVDHDKRVRAVKMFDNGSYPAFSLALAKYKYKRLAENIDKDHSMLIDWMAVVDESGASPGVDRLEIESFLNAKVPGDCKMVFSYLQRSKRSMDHQNLMGKRLKDKVVLIGSNHSQIDRHLTPFDFDVVSSPVLTGAQIHLHATQQLIDGRKIQYLSFWMSWGVLILTAALASLLIQSMKGCGGAEYNEIFSISHNFGNILRSSIVAAFCAFIILIVILMAEFMLLYFNNTLIPSGLMMVSAAWSLGSAYFSSPKEMVDINET